MKDVAEWRKRIDEIDRELLRLLNERAACAIEIGRRKKALSMPVLVPEREAEILRNVVESNAGPLADAAVRRLFERIIDEARSVERHVADQDHARAKEL